MELEAGKNLGPYQIVACIGVGGMGRVYRARDNRLGRDVAIKVLSDDVAKDPNWMRRFTQEARATSALNHPNILAIYDVGTYNGVPYVVSELLDGETLRKRLASGSLTVRKILEYGVQIARGLAAAHEKGIVHRDLKPENLFVTRDGLLKILDFGLAKVTEEPLTAAIEETATVRSTLPGTLLGTVGYMSPEQVRGLSVDHRSDIFSLGIILHEMLSGRTPFGRESGIETLSAILKEEPPQLPLGPEIPPVTERVVRRCLEKDRNERFQSARDVAFALEALSDPSRLSLVMPIPRRMAGRRWALASLLLVIAILGGVALFLVGRGAENISPIVVSYQRLTFERGRLDTARFAADGRTILYSARWGGDPVRVFTTRTENPQSSAVPLPSADLLSVAPTGEIALSLNPKRDGWVSIGTLARAPLVGNTYREVFENATWADWTPDGANIALIRRVDGKDRLEYPPGKVLRETSGYFSHIRMSPRGNRIAFLEHPVYADNRGYVAMTDLAGKVTRLTDDWPQVEGLAWTPSGGEIWFTGDRQGENLTLYGINETGRMRQLLAIPGDIILHDISRDGRVLLSRLSFTISTAALVPGASTERDLTALTSLPADISRDGSLLLLSEFSIVNGKDYGVYVRKTDGSPPVRVGDGFASSLSPDGKWTTALLSSERAIAVLPIGPGEPRKIKSDRIAFDRQILWFPNGRELLARGIETGHLPRMYIVPLEGGEPHAVTPEGMAGKTAAISPDGTLFAAGPIDGVYSLYTRDGTSLGVIPGFRKGEIPVVFLSDGKTLLVYEYLQPTANIYKIDIHTGKREIWKEIRPSDPAGVRWGIQIVATADGNGYAYGVRRYLMDLYLASGIR